MRLDHEFTQQTYDVFMRIIVFSPDDILVLDHIGYTLHMPDLQEEWL